MVSWEPTAILQRLEERQLASDRRAGSFARAQVVQIRRDFIKRAWWVIIMPLLGAFVAWPLVLLLPLWCREFALGIILTSGVWGSIMVVVTLSGTTPRAMGAMGEEWTARELRRLRGRRWYLANGLLLRPASDVDHVVIGPGGVLVVETKYSSDGWHREGKFSEGWVQRAIGQAKRNQKDVASILRPAVASEHVKPVVVLWGGAAESARVSEDEGVTIVPGIELRKWLALIEDNGLDHEAIAAAWQKVKSHIASRDKAELSRLGPPPRDMLSWFLLIAGVALVGMIGFLAELAVLQAIGTAWFPIVGIVLASLAWIAYRFGLHRRWLLAWLIGTQAVTFLCLVVYTASGLTHILH